MIRNLNNVRLYMHINKILHKGKIWYFHVILVWKSSFGEKSCTFLERKEEKKILCTYKEIIWNFIFMCYNSLSRFSTWLFYTFFRTHVKNLIRIIYNSYATLYVKNCIQKWLYNLIVQNHFVYNLIRFAKGEREDSEKQKKKIKICNYPLLLQVYCLTTPETLKNLKIKKHPYFRIFQNS